MKTKRSLKKTFALITMSTLLLLMNGLPVVQAAPETWDISTGNLVINSGGTFTVTGSTLSNTISVNTSDPVTITLNNVSIDVSAVSDKTAFDSGGDVTLYLSGSNTLKSSTSQAGVRVTDGEQITVSNAPASAGSLVAVGGAFGAGIGGGYMQNGGAVTISSGSVTAIGGDFAAGIGGAYTGSGGAVTITGGTSPLPAASVPRALAVGSAVPAVGW